MARQMMNGVIPAIPVVGRLYAREYLALMGSFILLGLEVFVRIVTLALPSPVFSVLYGASRQLFNLLSSAQGRQSRIDTKPVSAPIAQAASFTELCELSGYYCEEHVIQTSDGYLLGVHRVGWRKGEEDQRVNCGEGSVSKKVVYLHHGLMMNSEVWVCLTEEERCLPFMLVEQGYDVWLGNNRGNKYSKKSVHTSPVSTAFWDFSIDELAFHDIPDTIKYILATTKQKSLAYIGFSQGSAQAFASLSTHPTLNDQVDVFIALAPAMAPPNLALGIVSSLVKASPEVLFLAFGRKAILSSATMWEALIYPALFCWMIDASLHLLFGWKANNITGHQKLAAYPHLYSFSSTKSLVHWFQIIRTGTFQMYDDEVQRAFSLGSSKGYKVAKFPTRNIKSPIILVYGGSDSLVDIRVMLKELPRHTVAIEVPHYEHLDFLWAHDVHKMVFPHVLNALEAHAGRTHKFIENGSIRSFLSPSIPAYTEKVRAWDMPLQGSSDMMRQLSSEPDRRPSIDPLDGRSDLGSKHSPTLSQAGDDPRLYRAGHSPLASVMAANTDHIYGTNGHATMNGSGKKSSAHANNRHSTGSSFSNHSTSLANFGQHGIVIGAGKTLPAVEISRETAAQSSLRALEGENTLPDTIRHRKKG